jgi:MOSC domain-containing protein YiiM
MKPATGKVASLHLHPEKSGAPLKDVAEVEAIAGKGLAGDRRYFARISRRTGLPSKRQVTLIEREVLARHAVALGCPAVRPGDARANIETEGIDLASTVGHTLRVGSILMAVVEHREPCAKMDALQPGLRSLMAPPCQGVIAVVVESGHAAVGDDVMDCGPALDAKAGG